MAKPAPQFPINPLPNRGHRERSQFRYYALDGARLFFHPATGTCLRIRTESTSQERRTAPRVVMFGITNECNRDCEFCSRERSRKSSWTVESAAAVLKGLADAGTLEVAFGGGEPFAFAGFAELVTELFECTPLALNVTTNGTLLDEHNWPLYAGRFGEIRISVYDDQTWRHCAELFQGSGQRWGVNLLVDDRALEALPAQLADVAVAGCHDVSLLSYVGVPERQLSPWGRAELARIVKDSPLPCRLSVCLGEQIEVPRLWAGFDNEGDCGAGGDFISIMPDQQVQSCSYQAKGLPASTADEVLVAWRALRTRAKGVAKRPGCARAVEFMAPIPELPPVTVWQSFSGNNSGECILVAKFQSVGDAELFLNELLAGWTAPAEEPAAGNWTRNSAYSQEWLELFKREQVAGPGAFTGKTNRDRPDELVAIGPSVLAWGYGCDDNFPELRALAWKRGAWVLPDGIHMHQSPTLLAAIRCKGQDDQATLLKALPCPEARAYPHGDLVLLTLPLQGTGNSLAEMKVQLLNWSGERRISAEIFDGEPGEAEMVAAKKHLGETWATRPRLTLAFLSINRQDDRNRVGQLAQMLVGEALTRTDALLLVDPARGRKRLAVLAYRQGAVVHALDGERVAVSSRCWLPKAQPTKGKKPAALQRDIEQIEKDLRRDLPRVDHWTFVGDTGDYWNTTCVLVHTKEPGEVLRVLDATARNHRLECQLRVADIDPLGWAIRRVMADVRGAGRLVKD